MAIFNSYVNVCKRLRMGKSAIIGEIMIHMFIIPGKSWQDVSHEDLCRIYAALKGIWEGGLFSNARSRLFSNAGFLVIFQRGIG